MGNYVWVMEYERTNSIGSVIRETTVFADKESARKYGRYTLNIDLQYNSDFNTLFFADWRDDEYISVFVSRKLVL